MTDTAENAPETTVEPTIEQASLSNEQVGTDPVPAQDQAANDFSFVLDKYKKEGRTDMDAALEQAKAYKELQSKFGSFVGAPDEYEIALSEGLKDKIDMEDFADDPILQDAKEMAKTWGMNNEGFNQMVDLYFRGHMADLEAIDKIREEEIKSLGNNAERRLNNIQDWAKVNLDSDASAALIDSLTSAATVHAVEQLIAKTRNAQQVQDSPSQTTISHEELRAMQVAKDEFGNPKMNDPEYRNKVNKLYDQKFGAQPHSITIG
ncbi:MAG: hypothetical protein OEX12_01050 [Gammaproteobacteria bacterium]|nr:hypothetical protein [Gammaproteobacteria bacterium]